MIIREMVGLGVVIDEGKSDITMGMMGSNCRRSNFVFVQGDNIVAKYDDEVSDDKDLNDEARIPFVRSDAESDDVSLPADNVRKHDDPLAESIKELHFAQEEFEKGSLLSFVF